MKNVRGHGRYICAGLYNPPAGQHDSLPSGETVMPQGSQPQKK
jgi:hypothetical protein